MVAANAVTAIYLAGKKFLPSVACCAIPNAGRASSNSPRNSRNTPAAPDAVALEGFLTRRRAAAPEKFADLSLSVIKLIGAANMRWIFPAAKPLTLCAGSERLHPFHRAEPALSRSHHATALKSRTGWRSAALHHC